LRATARSMRLRRAPRVVISQRAPTPHVIGLLRPVIVLPTDPHLSTAELRMALDHEMAHVRRADLWLGLVPGLARVLFFFHPLVRMAVREYVVAREAACDVAALAAGPHEPSDYGRLLLR